MSKYKVGDRVITLEECGFSGVDMQNKPGTVIECTGNRLLVKLDGDNRKNGWTFFTHEVMPLTKLHKALK